MLFFVYILPILHLFSKLNHIVNGGGQAGGKLSESVITCSSGKRDRSKCLEFYHRSPIYSRKSTQQHGSPLHIKIAAALTGMDSAGEDGKDAGSREVDGAGFRLDLLAEHAFSKPLHIVQRGGQFSFLEGRGFVRGDKTGEIPAKEEIRSCSFAEPSRIPVWAAFVSTLLATRPFPRSNDCVPFASSHSITTLKWSESNTAQDRKRPVRSAKSSRQRRSPLYYNRRIESADRQGPSAKGKHNYC